MARKSAMALVLVGCVALAGCSAKGGSSGASQPLRRPPAPAPLGGGAGGTGVAGGPNAAGAPNRAPASGGAADSAGGSNRFGAELDPFDHPQSTFAMDVDTASYGYARNLINQGQRPAPGDVRPEEFVNAFRQDYPQPDGNGFTVQLDGARLPGSHRPRPGGDVRLLRVGLQTRAERPEQRGDAALTFVIDVSGSMGEPGKLDLVKDALHTLVDQLRPTDSVAIVTFSDEAKVLRSMTPVSQRAQLHAAVDRLETEGSTNLEAGLVTGYRVARQGFRPGVTNRVILLSDGLANMGDTQAAGILARVREEADKQITLLGVGVGSDYGDTLMEQLADHGDGATVYVSEQKQARQVFVSQLPANLSVRALDAKVQVTFDPRTVAAYRLIGYDDRALDSSAFRDDRVDGGEVGPGHSVTALYTVRLREGAAGPVAHAQIRWQDPGTREANERGATIGVADLGGDFAGASPRLQVAYAAAYFAESLRRSPYGAEVSLSALAAIAAGAADRTDDAAVADLAGLIRRAAD
jgi:Ca-activated chloride channel family protein